MIQTFDVFFETREELDAFEKQLKIELEENNQEVPYQLYCSFLDDIFRRSLSLQRSVENTISNDLISCVNIPWKGGDDFDSVGFMIASKSGRKVKKGEELMFKNYCDKYFSDVVGLQSLFDSYFPPEP